MGLTREQLMAGVTTVNGEDYERKESEARKAARIKRAEGGKTVGEIFDGKASLAGQEVSVRGRVVKLTPKVMGKNWIHLQDGTTGAGEASDLTVTSEEMAEVGNTVLARGVVAVDRDFGFGYEYDLIIEDADITVE